MDQFNFPELIAQGKEIDKTLTFLNLKLLEPSKLGNGREARSALREIGKDIAEINSSCHKELKRKRDEYESALNVNKMVYDHIERIDEVLDKLESEAVPYNYETYESHCPQNENNVKVSNDYLNVSGIESLSICDPGRSTPVITCHGGNRKLQFNDTLSSTWSNTSPIRSTPRVFVGNSLPSSNALNPWQQKKNTNSTNRNPLSRFNR